MIKLALLAIVACAALAIPAILAGVAAGGFIKLCAMLWRRYEGTKS